MVDDSSLFLQTAAKLLVDEPGIEVVGSVLSAREALEQVSQLHPDVVLMDLFMPEMDGLEATRRLKFKENAPRVVIVTMEDTPAFRLAARTDGADGFLSKKTLPGQLVPLLRELCA
jgi:DNA-binding NarL/FixJ family response regulator